MSHAASTLHVLPERYAICRFNNTGRVPSSALSPLSTAQMQGLFAVTVTRAEISIVCPEEQAPEGARREDGWRALEVAGPLDFALTGILAALTVPLAEAAISVFAVSTYDTDYLLVRAVQLVEAVDVLEAAGHRVHRA